MLLITRIIKLFLLAVACLVIPFTRLQSFRKRKRLPPVTNKTLLLSATEIARRIRTREITCQEVISVYIERCKEVNPILNAIVEARFEEAVKEARKVDEFLRNTAKTLEELARESPLLGVPITVKESIGVQGLSHSVGLKKETPEKADRDATVVSMVRQAGGIILLVSNTPELCLCWETYNNVTGRTWNPYDTNRTSGGSSGGEAALLGSGASVVSLASDIAGSGRIPAMFCGIFGHKPTRGCIPHLGHYPTSNEKEWPDYFSIATMTRFSMDLRLMMKIISQPEEARRRMDQQVSFKDMKFFYFDEGFSTMARIDQDMQLAIRRLKRHIETTHGVKVQKVDIKALKYSFVIASLRLLEMKVDWIYKSDVPLGSNIFREVLKYILGISHYTFPLLAYGLMSCLVKRFPPQYHLKIREMEKTLKREFEELLGENGVLICPSFPTSAYYPYESAPNAGNFTNMMVYNVLGLPVTQCPMGFDRKALPIGLQVVANEGCDHLTITVAEEVERTFGGWQQPSNGKPL